MKNNLFKIMCIILVFGLVLPMIGLEISADAAGTYFGFKETFQVDASSVGTDIAKGYNGWALTTSSGTQWLDKKIIFYKESGSDNITARFTAEKEHETYTNADRRNHVLNYDLSSVSNSDYFEFAYSLKSTGEPYLFQALVNGLHVGDIDFRNMKIGGTVYNGSADSDGWYNIKLVGNTTNGKIYIFVNDVLHLETTNASLTSKVSILHLGLISTDCSGADMQLDNVEFNFLTENEYLDSAGIVTSANPKVFVIGDSTAADYVTYSENEIAGWAQVLYNYMDDSYMIEDYAEPGASSKSFYNYKWAAVIPKVEKGDYVLIQFGHNDSATTTSNEDLVPVPDLNRYTSPTDSASTEGSYKWYLSKYVSEVRAKEAIPVFVTSIERRNRALDKLNNPSYVSSLDTYANAMIALSKELNVPVLDLHTESIDLIDDYEKKESSSSENLFMISVDPASNDNTHLTQKGAMEISKRFCNLLSASDAEILTAFKNHLKDDLDSVVFAKRLFKVEEDFENVNLVGTSISNGYNGWALQTSSAAWADKDIVFNKEANGNITARFTAAVADPSNATQIDGNRKLRLFNYDLSTAANSDCFQLEYSLKSTGVANEYQVIVAGKSIGNINFADMKIGGTVYNGSADSNGWYNVKIYGNTATGKTYYYVNNVLHKTSVNTWLERIGIIQFGLVRTVCSGADIQLDNVLFKFITEEEFCDVTGEIPSTVLEPVKFVKSGNNITGLTVKAGYVPAANNKFIVAVYSSQGEFKGARFAQVTSIGENDITLDNPIAYENGDTINVYYWDMSTLKPLSQPYNTLN